MEQPKLVAQTMTFLCKLSYWTVLDAYYAWNVPKKFVNTFFLKILKK